MKKNFSDKIYTPEFIIPALILYLTFFIIPNIASVFISFTDWSLQYFNDPRFNGFDNFEMMFTDPIFLKSILNTFYFTFVSTIFKVGLGLIFAIALDKKLKFQKVYRVIIFAPIMVSQIVVALVFSGIYHPERGLINSFLRQIGLGALAQPWLLDQRFAMNACCLMDIWIGSGLLMAVFLAGLQSIPKDCIESATIDGASGIQMFLKVTFPLIIPAVTVNTAMGLIAGLKVFGEVYGLTNGGPNNATQVVGTFLFKNFGSGMLGYTAAIGLFFTILTSLLSFLQIGTMRKREVEL